MVARGSTAKRYGRAILWIVLAVVGLACAKGPQASTGPAHFAARDTRL